MQETLVRPPRRAAATIFRQSSRRSSPSIFQISGSTPPILELLDRLNHQLGSQPEIVGLDVPLEPVELELFGGHEQLEHEQAFALLAQVVRESLQPLYLSSIPRLIALRIVAHVHFAKRRVHGLYGRREVLARLEVDFSLTALLGG